MGRQFRFKRALGLCVLLLLSCGISGLATGQENSNSQHAGRVRGKLLDPAVLAIPDAPVTIRSVLPGTSNTARTKTDRTFEFDGLDAGSYVLTATANGLVLVPKQLEIRTGEISDAGELRMSLVAAQQQVVVSASRVNELQDETPTKVLSITKQEIQDTGYERVGDVLAEVPGVVTLGQSYGVSPEQ